MNNEYISIIMPVKNVQTYIKGCIDSIRNQTHKKYEFIIVDASTDNTPKIINSFKDNRIKHIPYEGNISNALNLGLRLSSYDIICRMDGDDYCKPERIEHQLDYLLSNKGKIDLLGCNIIYIDNENKEIVRKRYPESDSEIKFSMPFLMSLPHPTLMTYKSIIYKANNYNEKITFAEDLDLFLKLIKLGYKFHNLQEYLYFYRYKKEIDFIGLNNSSIKSQSYDLGKTYLDSIETSVTKGSTSELQLGFLEYYKGTMSEARKHFRLYFNKNPLSIFRYFRYYLLSHLHYRFINKLRYYGIPQKIHYSLLKYLKLDLHFRRSHFFKSIKNN